MGLYLKEQQYFDLFNRKAVEYNVPITLLLAHARQESNFNPNAYRAEPALNDGSTGLMQILLKTAIGIDSAASQQKLYDTEYNLTIAAKLIRKNLDRYSGNGEFALTDAIAAYNAGTAYRDEEGIYTNSKGSTNVNKYVTSVVGYMNEYENWLKKDMPSYQVGFPEIFITASLALGILAWLINRKKS